MKFARLFLVGLIGVSSLSFAQWMKLNSGSDASLRGVSAPGFGVCWVSGSNGTVLLTTDGGAHWAKRPVQGGENLDFRDIEGFDESTAVIMSSGPAEQGQAKVFVTTDAGAHWKQTFTIDRKGVFLDAMAFWGDRGLMLSDPIDGKFILFATEDRGASWRELKAQAMPPALPNEGAFAASGTALAVAGTGDAWFGTGGGTISRIFHSSDGGQHWAATEVPIAAGKSSEGVFGLAFAGPKLGVAVGGDYKMKQGRLTSVAITRDGGQTWKAETVPLPPMQGVAVVSVPLDPHGTANIAEFHAVGNAAASMVLTDSPNPNDIPAGAGKWNVDPGTSGNAVAVVRDGRFTSVYVVGGGGSILLNRDGPDH